MDTAVNQEEGKNKTRGMIWSFALHAIIVILAFLPFLTYPDPPPGQEGILVNLGIPDVGQGDENAPEPVAEEISTDTEEAVDEETVVEDVEEEAEEEVEEVKPKEKTKKETSKKPEKEVVKTEDPKAIALKKKKEKERKEREKAEREKRAEEERVRKAKAEKKRKAEEARKKREAAAAKAKAEADAYKNSFGELGGGNSEGNGNTGKQGNQGRPDGEPGGDVEGSGPGVEGFGDRGFSRPPEIKEKFQKSGTIVIKVCANSSGYVTSAKYTANGSTITDTDLKKLAIKNAKKYKFDKSSNSQQCGKIIYKFRLD